VVVHLHRHAVQTVSAQPVNRGTSGNPDTSGPRRSGVNAAGTNSAKSEIYYINCLEYLRKLVRKNIVSPT
jgi:hypothetical protein